MKESLRHIPSVHKILGDPSLSEIKDNTGEGILLLFIRQALDSCRKRLLSEKTEGSDKILNEDSLYSEIIKEIIRESNYLPPQNRRAINASGIILHTGLGRAPLGSNTVKNLFIASGYNLVQLDPQSNARSLRESYIEMIMKELSGAEATTVVNNNAAASFLMLEALYKGKEVIISRGHLVEIGGSYRMPDILSQSGCIMKEIGTTNKTHLKDYESAIHEHTGALLYVHQSNFRIHGFASIPSLSDLCALGKKHNIPVVVDLGSGALVSMEKWGLPHEDTVKEVMDAGATVCCFSGDKLIGGPQAGILCGSKEAIEKIRKSSFSRMFRVCKLTLRALESTLTSFANNTHTSDIPVYQILEYSIDALEQRGAHIIQEAGIGNTAKVIPTLAYLGGGSSPDAGIESRAIAISVHAKACDTLVSKLHSHSPGIFPRIHDGMILFDLRTIFPEDDHEVSNILKESFAQ
jgi:L-seryl-tRNA(Ser) seleniumtransferase